jgi:hypothetical protein
VCSCLAYQYVQSGGCLSSVSGRGVGISHSIWRVAGVGFLCVSLVAIVPSDGGRLSFYALSRVCCLEEVSIRVLHWV